MASLIRPMVGENSSSDYNVIMIPHALGSVQLCTSEFKKTWISKWQPFREKTVSYRKQIIKNYKFVDCSIPDYESFIGFQISRLI